MNKRSRSELSTLNVGSSTLNVSGRQKGMALVITLIMISVITFMAVTFLAISRRDKGAVTTVTDQTTARLAADAAFERVRAELLVPMLVNTNGQIFDLVVSTNFFNAAGFDPTPPPNSDPRLNVNYDYADAPGNPPLTEAQFRQNIANLYYNARPPMFVRTNGTGSPLDFRFYLDLNRNSRFDTNGFQPELNNLGQRIGDTNFVGDPEWIGILEKPDQPHSSSNRFVARYAYIAIPAGKTLDINYIHNQAKNPSKLTLDNFGRDFLRNQGVGTWEVNLAAFLYDLNTNVWGGPYTYDVLGSGTVAGNAFADAGELYRYRLNGPGANAFYNTLPPPQRILKGVDDLFGGVGGRGSIAFGEDTVDGYTDGLLMSSPSLPLDDDVPVTTRLPWPGADNTNHFFTTQDFFDRSKVPATFANRLQNASARVSSYDRNTLYRMLSQLGTDSGPEKDKLNINYSNAVTHFDINGITNMVFDPNTNFHHWSPTQFFTLAADRLLRVYTTNWFLSHPSNYMTTFLGAELNNRFDLTNVANVMRAFNLTSVPGFGVTEIPVWVSNKFVYTPSVHRLLQLAANIYDATTNASFNRNPPDPYLPHVFRPIFQRRVEGTNYSLFIVGYDEVAGIPFIPNVRLDLPADARDLAENNAIGTNIVIRSNLYNVPWVIGAKKGFPNFNEFSMLNTITVTRRLEMRRKNWELNGDANDPANTVAFTNQLYSVGISNLFGLEAWNSYQTNYPRRLQMSARSELEILFYGTNSQNQSFMSSNYLASVAGPTIPANSWTAGVTNVDSDLRYPQVSFVIPLRGDFALFGTNSTNFGFLQSSAGFDKVPGNFQNVGNTFPIPRWWVKLRSRVRYFLLDNSVIPARVVDYVSLSRDEEPVDITFELTGENPKGDPNDTSQHNGWFTNRLGGSTSDSTPTVGIQNQIRVGLGNIPPAGQWRANDAATRAAGSVANAIPFFKYNLGDPSMTPTTEIFKTNIFHAPYDPFLFIEQSLSLQANDPLVHYTEPDLFDPDPTVNPRPRVTYVQEKTPLKNLGKVNARYQPWGVSHTSGGKLSDKEEDFDPQKKDPRVFQSDDWQFPTNKLPNIGWLGRVHRGTPWQTIYMKSPNISTNDWATWTGDLQYFDADRTRPLEDRFVFDLFTTAINDNATRGQLSVNQPGLAAWSAVLSGVITLTNGNFAHPGELLVPIPVVIEPAGVEGTNALLGRIVESINRTRNQFPQKVFNHVGDILTVPELTVASPFLYSLDKEMRRYGINDAMYERIPQQIMSLLRLDDQPRFVIYSFGQTLKPAPRSIITSGSFFGMCTNYQVTAETATRAVVRVEGAPVAGITNLATPHLVVESFNVMGPD